VDDEGVERGFERKLEGTGVVWRRSSGIPGGVRKAPGTEAASR